MTFVVGSVTSMVICVFRRRIVYSDCVCVGICCFLETGRLRLAPVPGCHRAPSKVSCPSIPLPNPTIVSLNLPHEAEVPETVQAVAQVVEVQW